MLLFLVIFIWTPPHFWALAVRYRDDYAGGQRADDARRGVAASHDPRDPRLLGRACGRSPSSSARPRTSAGSTRCRRRCSGAVFTFYALRLYRHAVTDRADVGEAMRLFHFSITYLTALFVLMAVDVLVRLH